MSLCVCVSVCLCVCLYTPPFFFDTTVRLQPNLARMCGLIRESFEPKNLEPLLITLAVTYPAPTGPSMCSSHSSSLRVECKRRSTGRTIPWRVARQIVSERDSRFPAGRLAALLPRCHLAATAETTGIVSKRSSHEQ